MRQWAAIGSDQMKDSPSSEYLRNAVQSASPEQLTLMLYDGAIRFALQARDAMSAGDAETACEKLIRAQKIVLELRNGLRYEVSPALCEQMAGLYDFIYNRLVDANLKRSVNLIDEAVKILRHQRDTWQMLIDKVRSASGGRHSSIRGTDAESSLCIEC